MLEIRLFGQPQVVVDGVRSEGARSRPVACLLSLLALRAGQPVTRSWLAGTLWPDSSESQALLNLRVALMRLRHLMGPEAERISTADRHALRLDLTGAWLDVAEFDSCIAIGDQPSLQTAIENYTGPLAENCDVEWMRGERERRAEQYLTALERLAAWALSRGDTAAALEDWRRAVAADWTRDSAQRGVMTALEALKDAPAALLTYRDYRVRLWDEMGLEPDPETAALYRDIQARAKTGRPPDPGRQVPAAEEMRSPSNSEARRASIPCPLTELIGRETEVRGVADAIRSHRLVTLVGAGGIGKTQLSIEVARRLAPEFPDCAAFIELAQLSDGSQLASYVSLCLGIETMTDRPDGLAAEIAAGLAGGPALVVLDNCEHLSADAASLARALLERCPLLHILATSRERLGVTGELLWRVPPLALPDDAEAGDQRLNSPAVRLFFERAASALPEFRVMESEDLEAVCTICRRLDGIPLAIELAAARVGPLSLEQIAARLDDRFRLLTRGSRAALPRHQTLRSLIDWSYDLLTEDEKELLRLLSLFVGGWTLEAAEAVSFGFRVPGSELTAPEPGSRHSEFSTLDILSSLADRSLVLAEARGKEPRYRMLESIREYARGALSTVGEEEEARRCHLQWAVDLAESSAEEVLSPRPEAALDRLQTEFDNVLAALAWAGTAKGAGDLHLRLTAALWPFLLLRGHVPHGRNLLRFALDRTDQTSIAPLAHTLLGAAILAYEQNAWIESETLCRTSLDLFHALGDTGGSAAALLHLGHERLWNHDFSAAHDLLTECLQAYHTSGRDQGPAIVLIHLAAAARELGDVSRGNSLLAEGLELLRQADDLRTPFYCLSYLRNLARMISPLSDSRALLETCLKVARERSTPRRVAVILRVLGDTAEREGDGGFALTCHKEALDIHRATGNIYGLMYALQDIGNCCYRMGDYREAIVRYHESMELFRKAGYRAGLDTACNNLGSALFHIGETAGARELHREALAIFHQRNLVEGIAWSLDRLGIVEANCGVPERAAGILAAAAAARRATVPRNPWDQADWEEAVSRVRKSLGEGEVAALIDDAGDLSWQPTVDRILRSP